MFSWSWSVLENLQMKTLTATFGSFLVFVTACTTYDQQTSSRPDRTVISSGPVYTNSGGTTAARIRSNETLASDVARTLRNDARLSAVAPSIRVTADQGSVTLSGSVPSTDDIQRAEALVRNMPGIVSVNNLLRIYAPPGRETSTLPTAASVRSNETLASDVARVFRNDSLLSAAAPSIQITANQGTVTLNGIVPSMDDIQRADALVRSMPGVVGVNNLLRINSPTGRAESNRVYTEAPT